LRPIVIPSEYSDEGSLLIFAANGRRKTVDDFPLMPYVCIFIPEARQTSMRDQEIVSSFGIWDGIGAGELQDFFEA
jgi:hypothetical protein